MINLFSPNEDCAIVYCIGKISLLDMKSNFCYYKYHYIRLKFFLTLEKGGEDIKPILVPICFACYRTNGHTIQVILNQLFYSWLVSSKYLFMTAFKIVFIYLSAIDDFLKQTYYGEERH